MRETRVGDRVRSYDFEGRRDCYVEGVVMDIGEEIEGCPRCRIAVDRIMFAGHEKDVPAGHEVCPPVNGTPSLFGGVTSFIEHVRPQPPETRRYTSEEEIEVGDIVVSRSHSVRWRQRDSGAATYWVGRSKW